MKYIINEKDIPVLFSNEIVHDEVMQKAKSAGFLRISYDTNKNRFSAKCYGESSSLNIKGSPNDEKIIEKFLNGMK